jgi:hypothetical protein
MSFGRGTTISEIGSVSEIYVHQRAFDFGEFDLIEAVDGFVDQMREWLYRPQELPREAIYSNAVHEFLCKDCGSQYVMDSRGQPERIAAVRAGLRAMDALDYLEYFEWLAAQVEAMKSEINRLFQAGGKWDDAIRGALNHRSRDLRKIKQAIPVFPLIAGYLTSLPNLRPLEGKFFDMKMYELVESVPDYQARLEAAMHDGHWVTQMLYILCLKSGQRYHRHSGPPTVIDLKGGIGSYGVLLTRGEHNITQYPNRAELRDMSGKLITSVNLNETKPETRPLN